MEESEVVSAEYAEFFAEWTELNKKEYWAKLNRLRDEKKELDSESE